MYLSLSFISRRSSILRQTQKLLNSLAVSGSKIQKTRFSNATLGGSTIYRGKGLWKKT
jgi:hypothetical protein